MIYVVVFFLEIKLFVVLRVFNNRLRVRSWCCFVNDNCICCILMVCFFVFVCLMIIVGYGIIGE